MTESDSLHTQLRDSAKKMAGSGSPHRRLRDSAKNMAESGSPHKTLQGPRTKCMTGLSLASQRVEYREGKTAHLLSYKVSISLNLGEPMSHIPEVPSSVVSLAALDLAVWGLFSYRIPASGMEGCFYDLHNSRRSRYTSGSLTQPFLVC